MTATTSTTFVVQLTPSGRGAVAVLLVAGPQAAAIVDAEFCAANGQPLTRQPLDRIRFGTWNTGGEELIVVRRADERVEVHCHGGQAAVRCVVQSLFNRGATEQGWADWIDHAAASPIEADAARALAKARTLKTASILLDQQQGALRQALMRLHRMICDGDIEQATALTNELLALAKLGLRLTEPWRVVLCGQPNVGKSSLMNRLVGYDRAIVFDQPGTTRDIVTAWTAVDGWPVELSDSAGLRDSGDLMEVAGVELAMRHLRAVDLRVMVLDASQSFGNDERALIEQICPDLICLNKYDLAERAGSAVSASCTVVQTSAITGEGLDRLISEIVGKLVPDPPNPGEAVPFTLAQQAVLWHLSERLASRPDAAMEALRSLLGTH